MVEAVRNVTSALGSPEKRVTSSEQNNAMPVRKAIYAATVIEEGEVLTADNVTTKRPATGIPAGRWYEVLGRRATRAYQPDEAIEW